MELAGRAKIGMYRSYNEAFSTHTAGFVFSIPLVRFLPFYYSSFVKKDRLRICLTNILQVYL